MSPHPKRLVVFDWDGTLSDSTAIIALAIQNACRDLSLDVPSDLDARYVIGLGLGDALRHVAPGLSAAHHAQFTDRYRHHYLSREGNIPLFAGAREMLEALSARGHLLAVATGKSRVGLDRVLAQLSMRRLFVTSRCADEGFSKPHPGMLLEIMERVGAEPAETLMIGDTTHDLELARNAGVDSVAVSYGAHEVAGFAAFAPLATAHSIDDLGQWLAANI